MSNKSYNADSDNKKFIKTGHIQSSDKSLTESPSELCINQSYKVGNVYDLPLDIIYPNENNPRKLFSPEIDKALQDSIQEVGLLQPICVKIRDNDDIVIIGGERRYNACKALGLETIKALIVDGDEFELSIIENSQREDLQAMDRAIALKNYKDYLEKKNNGKKISLETFGAHVGLKKSTLSEILSLNKLDEQIQNEAKNDIRFTVDNLKTIARKKDKEEQLKAFTKLKESFKKPDERSQKNETEIIEGKRTRLKRLVKEFTALEEIDASEYVSLREELINLKNILEKLLDNCGKQCDAE